MNSFIMILKCQRVTVGVKRVVGGLHTSGRENSRAQLTAELNY